MTLVKLGEALTLNSCDICHFLSYLLWRTMKCVLRPCHGHVASLNVKSLGIKSMFVYFMA